MKPELLTVGESQSRIVVIDDFSGHVEEIRALAKAMAPFPVERTTRYPGVRRHILPKDKAFSYVAETMEACAQFIGGTYDFDSFRLEEASFSMVTTAPSQLVTPQKIPHFDQTDPNYLAVLHYLSDTPNTGTAFYRQISTGIEQVTAANCETFLTAAKAEAEQEPPTGYILGSSPRFEQIGFVAAVPDRLIIYQGALLHSGIIPRTMTFSDDPLTGRLTGNMFVRGH